MKIDFPKLDTFTLLGGKTIEGMELKNFERYFKEYCKVTIPGYEDRGMMFIEINPKYLNYRRGNEFCGSDLFCPYIEFPKKILSDGGCEYTEVVSKAVIKKVIDTLS